MSTIHPQNHLSISTEDTPEYCLYGEDDDKIESATNFIRFIESKEKCFDYLIDGKFKVFVESESDCLLVGTKEGIIYTCDDYDNSEYTAQNIVDMIENRRDMYDARICAVIVGNTIINNGDIWEGEVISPLSDYSLTINSYGYKFVTVSFDTIANLFNLENGKVPREDNSFLTAEALIRKDIVLKDFAEETEQDLSAEQKKVFASIEKLQKREKMTDATEKKVEDLYKNLSIPAGFTLLPNGKLHSPATVIVSTKKETGLMGMDENSYFGVILPKRITTIADAYEVLIPEGAKGKPYDRQGEWFFVPVSVEEQKLLDEESSRLHVPVINMVTLPLDSTESNPHVISFYDDGCHYCDALNYMDGASDDNLNKEKYRIMFNPTNFIMRPIKGAKNTSLKFEMFARKFACYHSDHETIVKFKKDTWHKILRNTALRSVSAIRQVD